MKDKKILSAVLVLALLVVLGLGIPVWATEGTVIDAATAEEAQSALDQATNNTTIRLKSGVDYGTLLVRPVLGADHTESGDWFTGNYKTELARTIEDVTIIGAAGAKVDAIVFDAGYKGSNYIEGAPDLMNYINIKNLVIDGIEQIIGSEPGKLGTASDPAAVGWQNHALQFKNFVSAILDKAPIAVRGEDGREAVRLISDIYGE